MMLAVPLEITFQGVLDDIIKRNATVASFYPLGLNVEEVKILGKALQGSQVTELKCRISDAGAKPLALALRNSNLRILNLESNIIFAMDDISDKGLKYIAKAIPYSQLTSLHLGSNSIKKNGAKLLAKAIMKSPHLKSLNIHSNRIKCKGAIALAKALPYSSLENLVLDGNRISYDGAKALAKAMAKSPKLKNLSMTLNRICDRGLSHFSQSLKYSSLTYLGLGYNQISDVGMIPLAEVLNTSSLRTLYLRSNWIGPDGINALALAIKSGCSLSQLYLDWNSFGVEGTRALASILGNSNLTLLSLKNNKIGNEGAIALSHALRDSKQLKYLDLGGNGIWFSGIKSLANSLKYSQLSSLKLDDNGIGDEGTKLIAQELQSAKDLRELSLRGNKLTQIGVIAIAKALSTSQITILDLGYNNIYGFNMGPVGVKALADALIGCRLETLGLDGNDINFLGVIDLIRKDPCQLRSLNLAYNGITDEVAIAIAEALGDSKIINLDISRNRIGVKGKKALDQAMAKLCAKGIPFKLKNDSHHPNPNV